MAAKAKKAKDAKPKKEKKGKKAAKAPAQDAQGQEGGGKGGGVLFALVSLLSALLVIAAVLGGFLFAIVHFNVMGVADAYRASLSNIPVLRLALPKDPEDEDDLTKKTPEELIAQIEELQQQNSQLRAENGSQVQEIDRLKKFEDDYTQNKLASDERSTALDKQESDLDAEKKQLEAMKYDVERMVAEGDKEGFAQYFASVSPEVAQEIYAQVVQDQQKEAENKDFVKLYENMDPSAAAKIFETLGDSHIDLIVDTLKGMKRDAAVEILAALSADFAAKVTSRLAAA